jgi:hypothetical protein
VVEIVPTVLFPPGIPLTLQVTAIFVVPVTVAVNCWVVPGATVAEVGETETCIGVAAIAFPESDMVPLPALVVTVTWHASDPAVLGLNWSDIEQVDPGARLPADAHVFVPGKSVRSLSATLET